MAKQTKTQIFRDSASEKEWNELYEFYSGLEGTSAEKENAFKEKYGFTFAAVKVDLIKLGIIEGKKVEEEEPINHVFLIEDITEEKPSKKVSMVIDEEVWEMFEEFANQRRQYTKKAVLNEILKAGLKYYE